MRDTILSILKEHKMMKVVELALQVWLRQNHREIPDIWHPIPEEQSEIQKTERLLLLFLPQMQEDGLVDIDPDYKYIRLKEEEDASS